MSKFNSAMEEILDVSPISVIEPEKKPLLPTIIAPEGTDLTSDLNDAYQESRENLQDIIENGKEALEKILDIAKDSEAPRAFEVYATLLKNMVEANEKLLVIQKQMREMNSNKNETNNTTIDKAIFVGSTSELGKLLKNNGQ